MYCQWQQEGESSKKQGRFCAWFVTNKRTKGERKKESQKFPDKQAPPHAVQSVQWADLVTSARGRGGIEGGRGGERESRRRRGSGALAVCGIGTLGGSWRGWGRLNHPWQWNAWLRRSEEKDEGEGGGKTIEVELLEWTITHQNGSGGEQDHMTCSQHPECVKLIESIKP